MGDGREVACVARAGCWVLHGRRGPDDEEEEEMALRDLEERHFRGKQRDVMEGAGPGMKGEETSKSRAR